MNTIIKRIASFILTLLFVIILSAPRAAFSSQKSRPSKPDTIVKIVHDTVYIKDTVYKTQVNYVDTNAIFLSQKKSFIYIKDTFNIDERTYYITDKNDTVKVFYFDYTYYIFKYHLKDSLVHIDSVLGCDLYTHCLCDDRERVVIFHTCEGESRMIVNMLNKQKANK